MNIVTWDRQIIQILNSKNRKKKTLSVEQSGHCLKNTAWKKCLSSEFLWSTFSHIRLKIESLYSVQMRENTENIGNPQNIMTVVAATYLFNPFHSSITFHVKTSHLIWKWVKNVSIENTFFQNNIYYI